MHKRVNISHRWEAVSIIMRDVFYNTNGVLVHSLFHRPLAGGDEPGDNILSPGSSQVSRGDTNLRSSKRRGLFALASGI